MIILVFFKLFLEKKQKKIQYILYYMNKNNVKVDIKLTLYN